MAYYRSRRRHHAQPKTTSGFREDLPQSVIDIFAGDAEPLTSPQRDNREAPTCSCGAPVYADGLCVRCCEDRHAASNRAQPPSKQRD